ncbi:uncharacterized protein BO80DRAFT_438481 [Aspergillus ibericus CBS 121593]|uniref:Uncharacterized protein n=1 Tax=Aspergillus ibericus CBS 121593 TaxID=1448316 RepID=A0A395GR75_9EURO|nr:hypothetical protein BO80DRAFT_438481 [Aspergillus ibericus CBS 121593]RAK96573.1 hypothetical protein BO80DRAFT_438481 [Aspergillus ibericus CBS 121593]
MWQCHRSSWSLDKPFFRAASCVDGTIPLERMGEEQEQKSRYGQLPGTSSPFPSCRCRFDLSRALPVRGVGRLLIAILMDGSLDARIPGSMHPEDVLVHIVGLICFAIGTLLRRSLLRRRSIPESSRMAAIIHNEWDAAYRSRRASAKMPRAQPAGR